jgi:hypothetical protein
MPLWCFSGRTALRDANASGSSGRAVRRYSDNLAIRAESSAAEKATVMSMSSVCRGTPQTASAWAPNTNHVVPASQPSRSAIASPALIGPGNALPTGTSQRAALRDPPLSQHEHRDRPAPDRPGPRTKSSHPPAPRRSAARRGPSRGQPPSGRKERENLEDPVPPLQLTASLSLVQGGLSRSSSPRTSPPSRRPRRCWPSTRPSRSTERGLTAFCRPRQTSPSRTCA